MTDTQNAAQDHIGDANKMVLADLTDPQLALLAARAQGWDAFLDGVGQCVVTVDADQGPVWYEPCTRWGDAGPLQKKLIDAGMAVYRPNGSDPEYRLGPKWPGMLFDGRVASTTENDDLLRAITFAFITVEAERQGVKWEDWL